MSAAAPCTRSRRGPDASLRRPGGEVREALAHLARGDGLRAGVRGDVQRTDLRPRRTSAPANSWNCVARWMVHGTGEASTTFS